MEDVAGLLKDLQLSEAELRGISVGGGLKGKKAAAEPQAVGRLFSEKPSMLE